MKFNKKRAFTLIEISIVLVIIGIILASVMKGRDLIKSSQIKEFNQVFVSQWETIANSYFSRMGAVLDDGEENGGAVGTTTDGFMDGDELDTAANAKLVVDALKDAGIDPCDLIRSGVNAPAAEDFGCDLGGIDVFKTNVDGEFAGKKQIQLEFTNYNIEYSATNIKRKNVIVFRDMPIDIGQAIDTIRDGSPDGEKGSIVAITTSTAINAVNVTPVEWVDSVDATIKLRDMVLILEH